MHTFNTHTLVLRRKPTERTMSIPCEGSLFRLKFPFHPLSSSSLPGPVRLSSPSLCVSVWLPAFEKDEGMSFISLNYRAPLQMFCRSHLVHRWDPSNQSSQLPLKSHHFPSSQMDVCLIYLKVRRSDFILTHQNLMWFKSFAFALTWKHKLAQEQ